VYMANARFCVLSLSQTAEAGKDAREKLDYTSQEAQELYSKAAKNAEVTFFTTALKPSISHINYRISETVQRRQIVKVCFVDLSHAFLDNKSLIQQLRPAIPVICLAPMQKNTFKYVGTFFRFIKRPGTFSLWQEVPRP